MTAVPPFPYTFLNGTTADAPQVMADLNLVRDYLNAAFTAIDLTLPLSGGTITGNLTITGILNAATLQQAGVVVATVSTALLKTGGTMTGTTILTTSAATGDVAIQFKNTNAGTVNQYWRYNSSKTLEVVNNAFSAVIFSLSDLGDLGIAGTLQTGSALNTVPGADIASAATINLDGATGNTPDITGTTTITAVSLNAGRTRRCRAMGAFVLTSNASIIVSGGTQTMVAGDYIIFTGRAAGVVTATIDRLSGKATVAPLSGSFTSTQQTLASGGTLTLAHGLGAIPTLISVWIVCITAELGYSIGDRLFVNPSQSQVGGGTTGLSIVPDATNLNIKIGTTGIGIVDKSTGGNVAITYAKWGLVIAAWV